MGAGTVAGASSAHGREALAYRVFDEGGLLLHASAVANGDRGYLFLGASGAGKTTLAGLAPGAVIHDDLVIVRPDAPGGWWLEPAPVPLQQHYPRLCTDGVRLARAYRLIQSASVSVEPLTAAQALSLGLSCTPVLALDRRYAKKVILRWRRLRHDVPIASLAFRPDPSFWPFVVDGPV